MAVQTAGQIRTWLLEGEAAGLRYRMAAPRQVMQGLTGQQTGRGVGSSVDFRDFRQYQPGDDLRRIDWSVYGRSDRLHVRLYRDELSPHVDILLDGSRSMDLEASSKARAASGLTAAMAIAARNSKFSHRVWMAREGCRELADSTRLAGAWEPPAFDSAANLPDSMRRLSPRFRPRSLRVLISDLLWMEEPAALLRPLTHQAAGVMVIQVLGKVDADPDFRGSVRLIDSESQGMQDLFIDAAALRKYKESVRRHQDEWQAACARTGAIFTTVIAEEMTEGWDLSWLVKERILEPD